MTRRPGSIARARAVFDCNTLIQAIAFDRSPAARCIELMETAQIELLLSRGTLAELRRVFNYPDVRGISSRMTDDRIAAFLDRLVFRATVVRRIRHAMDYPRDPNDEPYIDLAITAKADYLVTHDNDLLILMTGHNAECKRFRQISHPLKVVRPVDFLNAIAG